MSDEERAGTPTGWICPACGPLGSLNEGCRGGRDGSSGWCPCCEKCATFHVSAPWYLEALSAARAEGRAEGAAEEREACARALDSAAAEWTRRNVDIAKTDYAKTKTYRLARECAAQAAAIRGRK